jgi:serine/threonine protein kinase/Flp pilus assembly protein TadD
MDSDTLTGKMLTHYRIAERIGAGGMGKVYRAHDERLRRDVAIKVLKADVVGSGEQRDLLLAEARAAAPLSHHGIATIYEVGEHDDLVFIVMELVIGETLRAYVGHDRLRPLELARIGVRISEALESAHENKVVHGDVKPENIIVQQDHRIKLLDFGIAKRFASDTASATAIGEVSSGSSEAKIGGTLAYMAPERFRGKGADTRSDLFSLGVLLFELAAGHLPFPGPDATNMIHQIMNEPEQRLDTVQAGLPPEYARIVHALLLKDPEARFQSAREVRVGLTNLERELALEPALSAIVAGRRTVAVLPFKLMTPDRGDEYLCLALADALISGLSAAKDLLLRPTSSVMRYAGGHIDALVAARELNVELIVEGSLQKLGSRLRALVQVRNADGATLTSIKHDAEFSDLFGLQDQIVHDISQALGQTPPSQSSAATEDPVAYELFLRAVDRLSLSNRWDTRSAIEMLRNVVDLAPGFADAWARLAQACVAMAFAFEPEASWYEEAERAIERALALDSLNVSARVAKGRVLWSPGGGFQNRPALKMFAEAIRIEPNSHEALLWQSLVFLHVGLFERARAGLTEALAIQPNDPFTLNFIGQSLEFEGDYDGAEVYQSRALALDPSHLYVHLFQPTIFVRKGELERAERSIRTAEKLLGKDKMLISTEALIWAKRGDTDKALALVETAIHEAETVAHAHHAWHNLAAVYSILEQPESALQWLDEATKHGLPNYPLFRDDPLLTNLLEEESSRPLMAGLRREWEQFQSDFAG